MQSLAQNFLIRNIQQKQIMKSKLSFAQRLQRQSLSHQKHAKDSSISIQKKKELKKEQPKSRYMQFKQQHNELKCMLKMFQFQKKDQRDQTPELVPVSPVRPRINERKVINKNQNSPINHVKKQQVKENIFCFSLVSSANDVFRPQLSVVLPKSTPLIYDQRRNNTQKKGQTVIKKGIPNIGNTCYINALVQCLFHLPHFNAYFMQEKYKTERNGKTKDVLQIYRALYINVMNNRQDVEISTLPLKKSVSKICMLFIDWQQEDAHQFMKQLLNSIHEDLNRVKNKPKYKSLEKELQGESLENMAAQYWSHEKQRDDSYIYDSLCGQIYNNVRCINCNHQSQGFQNFLDLSIPMSQNKLSLDQLLTQFFQPQKLSDYYLCGSCQKSSKKSTKTIQLWRVPRFLIIHLKRSQFGKKNNDPIKIPQSLNLKSFMTISTDKSARFCQYNLCGMIMHQGVIDGGHYWCNVKQNGKWYEIDDQKVAQLNTQTFKTDITVKGSSSAYVLFYSSLYS